MAVAFLSIRELPNVSADGNPLIVKRFTHILLPIVEIADKEGESVDKRVRELFEVMQLRRSFFYHVCSDGGVEITWNSRTYGDGQKGMFSRSFKPEGCLWTWCLKHLLNIVYHKANFTDIYKNLDTVSRFLRVANRFNKLKPHMMLILKHDQDPNATR